MNNTGILKLQLMHDIIDLPNGKLQKVSDFVKSLLSRNGDVSPTGEYPSGHDPILDLIGIASYAPPANSIDEELYGEP